MASRIVAAVLTWNDGDRCAQTLTALLTHAPDLAQIVVYDNGSDVPFSDTSGDPRIQIQRGPTNRGAGGGVTQLMSAVLATAPTSILYVEDDFVCRRALPVAGLEATLRADPGIGRIALADRPLRPKASYYTFALTGDDAIAAAAQVELVPQISPTIGQIQPIWIAWSNYPCLIPPVVAERYLLHGWAETAVAKAFYADNWQTISCLPGWFYQARTNHKVQPRSGWTY